MDVFAAPTKQICTLDGKVICGKPYQYRAGLLMLHVVVTSMWRLSNGIQLELEVTHSHKNMFNTGYVFDASTADAAIEWQLLDETDPSA